jgi:hypothetical protein
MPKGALNFWEAFDRVEPIGDEYYRDAMIARSSAMYSYLKAGQEPPSVDDYMPSRYKRVKAIRLPTAEENAAQFAATKGMFEGLAALAKAKKGR